MHTCEMVICFRCGGGAPPEGEPVYCGRPAGLKREGVWLCAEHFDSLEEGGPSNWIALGERWIPVKIHIPTQLEEISS